MRITLKGDGKSMKLVRTITALLLVALMCCVAASLPDAEDGMTTDDCRNCHGDEQGSTYAIHHAAVSCVDGGCHIDSQGNWVDFRNCYSCHADFSHHDDANGRCADCHDDKQQRKGKHGC